MLAVVVVMVVYWLLVDVDVWLLMVEVVGCLLMLVEQSEFVNRIHHNKLLSFCLLLVVVVVVVCC